MGYAILTPKTAFYMIRSVVILIILSFFTMNSFSQDASLVGEYYLKGVQEVGAGFKFNPDHSYAFFFSYGALDREGSGTWSLKGDVLTLITAPRPAPGFSLVAARKAAQHGVTVAILTDIAVLRSNIQVGISCPGNLDTETDESGVAKFEGCTHAEKVSLTHSFFPDRAVVFTIKDPEANYFEYKLEPSIVQTDFGQVVMQRTKNGFSGSLPILEKGVKYEFEKAGSATE